MSNMENGIKQHESGAFVLDGVSPEDVALSMIEGGQKEPFYIYNMDEAYRRIQHFKDIMPRVHIFYAMKSNDWKLMLKLVVSQHAGFDCATTGEISKILYLGVPSTSIIYAIPTKTAEQMTFARNAGIQHTTFDSSCELKKIKQYWPDAKLLIRYRVDGDSLYRLGDKYGCDFETEAISLLEEAASLGIQVIGVAFHVGSGCSSDDSYVLGLQRARALFDHEKAAGRTMKIVDIGGGFLSARTDSIDPVAKLINNALDQYFPDQEVQIIAEPGRYLCDSAATLYNSIYSIRRCTSKYHQEKDMIYLSDGLHGTLRYIEPHHTVELLKNRRRNSLQENRDNLSDDVEVTLWGPTCDSIDQIMGDRIVRLPRCSTSDWLVFKTQGAYSYSYQGTFSCISVPKMRAVISRELWNQIKDNKVFSNSDFVLNADFSSPLPTSMPSLPPQRDHYVLTSSLIV